MYFKRDFEYKTNGKTIETQVRIHAIIDFQQCDTLLKITKRQETGTFIAGVRRKVDQAKHRSDASEVKSTSYELPLATFGSPTTRIHVTSIGSRPGDRPLLRGFRLELY